MLKHGLISTPKHLAELLAFDTEKINYALLKSMVGRSVQVKEKIVEEDPLEHGIRKALNLGHTVGHASKALHSPKAVRSCTATLWHGGLSVNYTSLISRLDFPRKRCAKPFSSSRRIMVDSHSTANSMTDCTS